MIGPFVFNNNPKMLLISESWNVQLYNGDGICGINVTSMARLSQTYYLLDRATDTCWYPSENGNYVIAKIPATLRSYQKNKVSLIGQMSCHVMDGLSLHVSPSCDGEPNCPTQLCDLQPVSGYSNHKEMCNFYCYCDGKCSFLFLKLTTLLMGQDFKICEIYVNSYA